MRNAVARVFKDTVALSVSDDVRLALADWQRRSGPDSARVFIAQVDDFTRRITSALVGPGGGTIFAAVTRPRAPAASLGNQKAEIHAVADNIGPRRGRPLFRAEHGDVFT